RSTVAYRPPLVSLAGGVATRSVEAVTVDSCELEMDRVRLCDELPPLSGMIWLEGGCTCSACERVLSKSMASSDVAAAPREDLDAGAGGRGADQSWGLGLLSSFALRVSPLRPSAAFNSVDTDGATPPRQSGIMPAAEQMATVRRRAGRED